MKKFVTGLLAVALLAGCGTSTSEGSSEATAAADSTSTETVSLTLWGAENDQDYLAERVEAFKAAYPDVTFDIQIGVESESTAKDTVLTDIQAAADVFAFADDQLADLVDAGALLALDDYDEVLQTYAGKSIDDIKNANVLVSIEDATYDSKLYAFPTSADNGYFLYYDANVFTEEDVKDWDTLLSVAAENGGGRKVGMTLASGWYNAGFFYGAGFQTARNDDGSTDMDWNGTSDDGIKGTDVALAMANIASNSAFMAIADGDISNQIASGNLCAVVSGTWDSQAIAEAFGEDYGATVLPTFNAGGTDVQMGSVGGCKLMGVNAYCENSGWAVLLADFLTNEESQTIHFEEKAIGPSNLNAQQSDAVQADKAISAVLAQSAYAVIQKVGGNYWTPTATFGEIIAQGNVTDEASAQSALDELVEGVSQAVN